MINNNIQESVLNAPSLNQRSDRRAIPSRSKSVAGICRPASFVGGTGGRLDAVVVGDVRMEGRAETLLLPP